MRIAVAYYTLQEELERVIELLRECAGVGGRCAVVAGSSVS